MAWEAKNRTHYEDYGLMPLSKYLFQKSQKSKYNYFKELVLKVSRCTHLSSDVLPEADWPRPLPLSVHL